jgi:hypothetical protein
VTGWKPILRGRQAGRRYHGGDRLEGDTTGVTGWKAIPRGRQAGSLSYGGDRLEAYPTAWPTK